METWKEIPDYEDQYLASDQGRIMSLARGGRRIRKQLHHPHGYRSVMLAGGKRFYVHRLVMAAFVGPCPADCHVDHVNRVRDDNRLCNLRYLNARINEAQGGYKNRGEGYGQSKLTNPKVLKIRRLANETSMTHQQIADQFGVTQGHVTNIINRKCWVHI